MLLMDFICFPRNFIWFLRNFLWFLRNLIGSVRSTSGEAAAVDGRRDTGSSRQQEANQGGRHMAWPWHCICWNFRYTIGIIPFIPFYCISYIDFISLEFIDWLIDWLIDSFFHWFIHSFFSVVREERRKETKWKGNSLVGYKCSVIDV